MLMPPFFMHTPLLLIRHFIAAIITPLITPPILHFVFSGAAAD